MGKELHKFQNKIWGLLFPTIEQYSTNQFKFFAQHFSRPLVEP